MVILNSYLTLCIDFCAGRSKSPGKDSRASSQERPSSSTSNPYIRAGSLKALKEEQDRIKAEEDEKERIKADKRSKSPKKVRTTSLYYY